MAASRWSRRPTAAAISAGVPGRPRGISAIRIIDGVALGHERRCLVAARTDQEETDHAVVVPLLDVGSHRCRSSDGTGADTTAG